MVFSKTPAKQLLKSTALLGQLRGIATKLGQMLSYVDGLVPPEHRDAFEKTMGKLQSATPASPPEEIRALIRQEFGKEPSELFATWEDEPIASASIGQVHRAITHDGKEVAVKVHHPGIVEALEADLQNAGAMEMVLSLLGSSKFETGRLMEEIKERFREELNYKLEAERIDMFRDIHKDDPTIRIPEVYHEFSTGRVLTTEFIRGMSYDEARQASPELREAWCETLWRFVYKAILLHGVFNADPHPGNLMVERATSSLVLLDFGMTKRVSERQRIAFARLLLSAAEADYAGLLTSLREMGLEASIDNPDEAMGAMRYLLRGSMGAEEPSTRANGGGEHMHGNIHVDVGSSEYWEHKVGGPPPKSRMWMAHESQEVRL